jgi:tetratricopeptide (TPR) repeat protein
MMAGEMDVPVPVKDSEKGFEDGDSGSGTCRTDKIRSRESVSRRTLFREELRPQMQMPRNRWKHLLAAGILLAVSCMGGAQTAPTQPTAPVSDALQQADAAFHAGLAAAQSGDLAAARDDFQKVVQLAPEVPEGHSALGSVLLQLGQAGQAIAELERALALRPEDGSAQINLAIAYEETQAYEKSLALFKAVDGDQADPLPANALISYARALAAIGHADLALARMQKAVAENSGDATLHDALGSLEAQRQDWANAEIQFAAAVALDASFADAHEHLGVTLVAEQRLPEAIRELTTATQLSPGNPAAFLELGKALAANGEDEKAAPVLQKAVELAPTFLDAKYQLALVLQRLGQNQQAIPLFQQVVNAQPHNAPALTNLALAMVQTGKSKEAIPLYQRAIVETPKDPLVHQDLGVAYLQQSDLDDAIKEFRAGLQFAPDAYELHYNLGFALKLKDDLPAATAELELAERLNPESPDPPYTLGILNMQAGRFDEAVRQLNLALKIRPENGDGWAILGSVYKQQNDLPNAERALREAVRLLPDQPGSHITLAGVLAAQGKKDEAAAERKIAADITRTATNHQRATFATNSGRLLLQQGNVSEAIDRFQEAISSDPNYLDAHRGLADAFVRAGKTADAESERQKIAAIEKVQPQRP